MKRLHFPLLVRIVIAIVLGILLGQLMPLVCVRLMATFSLLFSNFLQFIVPLIIVGLVTPAIADIGRGAGRLLLVTVLLAYADTVLAGYLSFLTSSHLFPSLIDGLHGTLPVASATEVEPFFTINIPPLMDVMTALVTAFITGLGIAAFSSPTLKCGFNEFKSIVVGTIERVIIPLLPLYICCIFLTMTHTGAAWRVLSVFVSVILVIFALHQ